RLLSLIFLFTMRPLPSIYTLFPYTTLFRSFHAEVFDFIGLDNVAVLDQVSSKGGGNTISMEQLLIWQPDVILFEADGMYQPVLEDRKSTRLNSSHVSISYAVFCLKKKKQTL